MGEYDSVATSVLYASSVVLTSPDGVTWTNKSSDASKLFFSLTWTGSQFVAAAYPGVGVSPDGVTWTFHPTTRQLSKIQWTGDKLVGVYSGRNYVGISNDAATWTFDTMPNYNFGPLIPRLLDVTAHADTIVAIGDGWICTSYDNGKNWETDFYEPSSPEVQYEFNSIVWAKNQFVAVGNYSNYDLNWFGGCEVTSCLDTIITCDSNGCAPSGTVMGWSDRSITRPVSADLYSVASSGARLVAVGAGGTIITSQDGMDWENRSDTNVTKQSLLSVIWSGGKFLAVGDKGAVIASLDGITWKSASSGVTDLLKSVAWTGKQFVAVGGSWSGDLTENYDRVLTSPDGITWTDRGQPGEGIWNSVIWTGAQLVAAGEYDNWATPYSSVVYTSPDGVTWTDQNARYQYTGLYSSAYNGATFVAVGGAAGHCALVSTDGIKWVDGGLPTGSYFRSVIWANNQFLATGDKGKIATSPDGSKWTLQTSNSGSILYSAATIGSLYVVVGSEGTILTSLFGNSTVLPRAIASKTAPPILMIRISGDRILLNLNGVKQGGNVTFEIFNASGKCLRQTSQCVTTPAFSLPLNGLASGRYFLRAEAIGKKVMFPFVIEK